MTASAFFDRQAQLEQVLDVIEGTAAGAPKWLAILGTRKVGKTSLVLEAARRSDNPSVVIVRVDVQDAAHPTLEFFRQYAVRTLDAALSAKLGVSVASLVRRPSDLRAAILTLNLERDLTDDILDLSSRPADEALARFALDLPERLGAAQECYFLVAIDEFQELVHLKDKNRSVDIFPMMRSRWQHHQRVSYIVSGSERSLLLDLLTKQHAPFFQHFNLLELRAFSRADAVQLLTRAAPEDRPVSKALADVAFEVLGGHPFYLQLFGEALTRSPPPYDDVSLKETLQELLFSRTGRLALYFENEHQKLVGRSTSLAAVLEALSLGPLTLTELARAIGSATGAARSYVDRLGQAVTQTEDGAYELSDETFAKWVSWRGPGGTVVPMTLVGNHAEVVVARALAEMGFELVYQSRASRGAFDLLAIRGAHQLGIQVKRSPLPLRFAKNGWARMKAESQRLGWRWVIASVDTDDNARFLDPKKAGHGKEVRLKEKSVIDNLLEWLG